jgi:hypothetical protein
LKPLTRALLLLGFGCLGWGCAHASAGTDADEQGAVAAGVRAGLRLYVPPNEGVHGPLCVEVSSSQDFEEGVVAALRASGVLAVAMQDCATEGKDALYWVRVQSYEWTDIVAHGTVDIRGTVETRPDERANFRLSWWRARFQASLGFNGGEWHTLSADDLGRM